MDAILILSGDPPADDEAVKKSTAFQVHQLFFSILDFSLTWLGPTAAQTWLLGYEFPSTIMLLQKDQITFLGSPSKSLCGPSLVRDYPDDATLPV